MAVKIKLKRVGKKKQPSYRIVVAEGTRSMGRTVAEIGYYNPLVDPAEIQLDVEAALYWLGQGAKPTPTAKQILSRMGVLRTWHERRCGLPGEENTN
jgi:small subunit ribosomal protein S16